MICLAGLGLQQASFAPEIIPVSQTFHCSLVTPDRQILDDDVTYVSLPVWDGLMGIAPQHAPLVAKLGDGVLRVDFPQGGSRFFYLSGGFAQMKDNNLSLLTSDATPAEQFSKQEISAKLKEAEGRTAETTEALERRRRDVQRYQAILNMLTLADNRI